MNQKLRVLQVVGSLRIGGLENVAMNIIRYSNKEKFDFTYVVYGEEIGFYEEEVKTLGGKVIHIDFPHKGINRFKKELRNIMLSNDFDIVHSHNLFNSGLVMEIAVQCGIPIRIAHSHTNREEEKVSVPRRLFQSYMRYKINKYSTHRYACSNRAGLYLFGKSFKNDGIICNNGVLTNRFILPESFSKKEFKEKLGINENEKVIGHIGRFVPVKNHILLIQLFEDIHKKYPETKLLLVGDGPLLNECKNYVVQKKIDSSVIFTGSRADIPYIFSIMDVFVMPSLHEGVSVALIEAQCTGTPYVVSDSAFVPESNITGYGTSLSLNERKEVWEMNVVIQMNRGKNVTALQQVKNKGYDIEDVITKLNLQYQKYINENILTK